MLLEINLLESTGGALEVGDLPEEGAAGVPGLAGSSCSPAHSCPSQQVPGQVLLIRKADRTDVRISVEVHTLLQLEHRDIVLDFGLVFFVEVHMVRVNPLCLGSENLCLVIVRDIMLAWLKENILTDGDAT